MGIRKFTDEQELEICRRYVEGESCPKLAKLFGVNNTTIRDSLIRQGINRRSFSQALRRSTEEQEQEIVTRYLNGENSYQLGKAYEIHYSTICDILSRQGIDRRSNTEVHPRKLTSEQEQKIASRYLAGENAFQISKDYEVNTQTIYNTLLRLGIERRGPDGFGDSVQHVLDGTGHHARPRECEFYLFELARYSDTHCKPGIAFDVANRIAGGRGEYGAEVLRLVFSARTEAFFLEQAVLDATRGSAKCPGDLAGWIGASEVRAMPADDLLPIIDRLAAELDAMGPWSFAAAYVPMTTAQRATCQQRAIACTSGHH